MLILLIMTAAIGGAVFLFFRKNHSLNFQNKNTSTGKDSNKKAARATDAMKLSRQEKAVLKVAKEMAKNGNIRPAAHLLEQSGLRRECIELLEKSGFVDDATSVLIKMQRPNRAGYVYARNKYWKKAADCFKTAGLMEEAAKCLQEDGQFAEAAKIFLSSSKYEEAAYCFVQTKSWQDAAKSYLKINMTQKAQQSYAAFFDSRAEGSSTEFEATELDFFKREVLLGELNAGYINALSEKGKILGLMRGLLSQGKSDEAGKIYSKSTKDIALQLIAEVNLHTTEGTSLAKMFHGLDQHRYTGMVYEQLGNFQEAAKAFERAGDHTRASYCYERTGHKETEAPMGLVFKVGAGVFSLESSRNSQTTLSPQDHSLFSKCNLFEDLSTAQRQKILELSQQTVVKEKEIVVQRSQAPAGFYFILEGQIDCFLESDHGETRLETLYQGDTFGELWLLAEHPASVRFEATTACRLLIIERHRFLSALDQDATMARKVYKHFTLRLLAKILNPSEPQDIRRAS